MLRAERATDASLSRAAPAHCRGPLARGAEDVRPPRPGASGAVCRGPVAVQEPRPKSAARRGRCAASGRLTGGTAAAPRRHGSSGAAVTLCPAPAYRQDQPARAQRPRDLGEAGERLFAGPRRQRHPAEDFVGLRGAVGVQRGHCGERARPSTSRPSPSEAPCLPTRRRPLGVVSAQRRFQAAILPTARSGASRSTAPIFVQRGVGAAARFGPGARTGRLDEQMLRRVEVVDGHFPGIRRSARFGRAPVASRLGAEQSGDANDHRSHLVTGVGR